MANLKFVNPKSGKFQNACYANAIAQVLSSAPMISDFYRSRRYQARSNDSPVSYEFSRILSQQGQSSTGQLREVVGVSSDKGYFYDGTQQDAAEFLRELITSLLKECSSDDQGTLQNFFKGMLTYQRGFLETPNGSCDSCGTFVNPQDETFYILDLPSRSSSSPSIQSLINNNYEVIEMQCPNTACMDKTNKKAGQSKVIVQLPSILFITIAKDFQLKFNGYELEDSIDLQGMTYQLVGLVDHLGNTPRSGHYIAWKKVNFQWYKCDDNVVHQVSQNVIPGINNYLFVYIKKQLHETHINALQNFKSSSSNQNKINSSLPVMKQCVNASSSISKSSR